METVLEQPSVFTLTGTVYIILISTLAKYFQAITEAVFAYSFLSFIFSGTHVDIPQR